MGSLVLGAPTSFPPALRGLRLVLRIGLIALGGYAVWHGHSLGKAIATREKAEMQARLAAYQAELDARKRVFDAQMDADEQAFSDNVRTIYRDLNTIFGAVNLPPIGDGQ